MNSVKRRLYSILGPAAGYAGAGLVAVLLGWPGFAQQADDPLVIPAEPPPLSPLEPSPSAPPALAPRAAEQPPASPFEPLPGVFPEAAPVAPAAPEVEAAPPFIPLPGVALPREPPSPFEPLPGVFPGLAPVPAPATAEQPAPQPGVAPAGALETAPPAAALPLLPPQYGFGSLAPIPGTSPLLPVAPETPATTVGLQPVLPGAIPIQALDPRAPRLIIVPQVTLSQGYSDNPRNTPGTFSDSISQFGGGTLVSVDTVRLQGQLNGSINYHKWARATDEDALHVNLAAFGLGTIVRDHVFVDARAAITQLSRSGGFAFADPTLIPPGQETQAITAAVSPFVRQSFDGYVDSELRYSYGLSMFEDGGLLGIGAPAASQAAPSSSLSNATRHRGTLSLATGRRFTVFGSKLTLDAAQIDSSSVAQSTQLRAYDDVEYQFGRHFAALGRIGYEDLDYPLQPAATTAGPTWLIGGRVTPFPDSYVFVRYGRVAGFYGFDGALRFPVTAATTVLASVQRNLSSTQEQILNNLNDSQLDAFGNLVNRTTGLPSALSNPQFALTDNSVFRSTRARAGVRTNLGRNNFGLFGFYDRRRDVGTPTTGAAQTSSGSGTAIGVNLNWTRVLTTKLASSAALGYAIERTTDLKTLTADWRLTYILSESLNAILSYRFIDSDGTAAGTSYRRNQVEIGVTRSF